MKITIEISHLMEVRELIASLDKHRVGACLLFFILLAAVGVGLLVWHLLQ